MPDVPTTSTNVKHVDHDQTGMMQIFAGLKLVRHVDKAQSKMLSQARHILCIRPFWEGNPSFRPRSANSGCGKGRGWPPEMTNASPFRENRRC